MKVLWLCNTPIKQIELKLGLKQTAAGGWLSGLSQPLIESKLINLRYCFFHPDIPKLQTEAIDPAFSFSAIPSTTDLEIAQRELFSVLNEFQPHVVHVFGSEYKTTYALLLACQKAGLLNNTLLHIQGLVSIYAKHFDGGIPCNWRRRRNIRDLLRDASIATQKKNMALAGIYEKNSFNLLRHVAGRTNWDRACATQMNPKINYHFYNETLRPSFYKKQWNRADCQSYRIFISQGGYPIKGLHYALAAMPAIISKFPAAQLVIAGNNPIRSNEGIVGKLKQTTYGSYIQHLIQRYGLNDHVSFTGPLQEHEMCEQFLKSHVFVSPSLIENSPNSLGEAMMLGMPIAASYVGGVPDMLEHGKEGFLYQSDAPYMLAHYVIELFENDQMAISCGQQARSHALKTHDPHKNCVDVLEIYHSIMRQE